MLAVVALLLWLLFQKTKIGLAMRAVASNPESAGLSGVPVTRLLLLGWGLAAALGAVAGILVAAPTCSCRPMMQGVLIYAFAAITLGGFDSFVGAVVGGFAVGIIESLVGSYVGFIGSQLKLSSVLGDPAADPDVQAHRASSAAPVWNGCDGDRAHACAVAGSPGWPWRRCSCGCPTTPPRSRPTSSASPCTCRSPC